MSEKYIIVFSLNAENKLYNIEPILPFIEKKGYKIILIHAYSLVYKQSKKNLGNNIELIDLNKLGVKKIVQRISSINCVATVHIGYKSLFDVLCLNLSHKLKLRSIYLEHGFFVPETGDKYKFSLNYSTRRYWHLSIRYLEYIRLFRLNFYKELKSILHIFYKRDFSAIKHNYALLYTETGKNILNKKFKFTDDSVYYSGYPMVEYNKDIEQIGRMSEGGNIALYIHQTSIKDRTINCSYSEEKEMLEELATRMEKQGLKLTVKLHPRESQEEYKKRFKDSNVILTEGSLLELFMKSKIVIGQYSTALFYAVKCNLPIIIVPYGNLDEKYYKVFEKISYFMPDDDLLKKIINGECQEDMKIHYLEFEKEYIGYQNSFENQALTLIEIIEK